MLEFEILAAGITLLSVWLTVRQNILCWPTGIASGTMYAVVFYQTRLYADMGLQVIYLLLSFYGWYEWLHGGPQRAALPITRVSPRQFGGFVVTGLILGVVLGSVLDRSTDASLPFLDSTLTALSLVAQLMLTRKLLENWLIWIAVDVFYVGMFASKGLYPTAVLYGVFVVLATRGWIQWRKAFRVTQPG